MTSEQEIESLTARVAELEKFKAERDACHLQFKRIYETLPARSGGYSGSECVDEVLTRLQELERKAKALDWLEENTSFCQEGNKQGNQFFTPAQELDGYEKPTVLSAIENAMEKQK